MTSRLIDTDELARVTNMNRQAILRLVRQGRIPHLRFSHKQIRFDLDRVLEAISAATKPQGDRPGGGAA
jgi:excisionase family DNA binding protein